MYALPRAENDNGPRLERRAEMRRRVLLTGKVAYLATDRTYDCVVRNLSASGARITAQGAWFPRPDPYLIVVTRAALHQAATVWDRDGAVGLTFEASWDLAEPVPGYLATFRGLWRQTYAR